MAINKKLIHFKSKELFNTELANGNILDNSIVFIKDTLEIWTHGQLYSCNVNKVEEKANFAITNGSTTLEDFDFEKDFVVELLDGTIKVYKDFDWSNKDINPWCLPEEISEKDKEQLLINRIINLGNIKSKLENGIGIYGLYTPLIFPYNGTVKISNDSSFCNNNIINIGIFDFSNLTGSVWGKFDNSIIRPTIINLPEVTEMHLTFLGVTFKEGTRIPMNDIDYHDRDDAYAGYKTPYCVDWEINAPKLTYAWNAFFGCDIPSLRSIKFNFPNLTDGTGMFACSKIHSSALGLSFPNLTCATRMFEGTVFETDFMSGLTQNWEDALDFPKLLDASYMFKGIGGTKSLRFLNLPTITNAKHMFYSSSLENLTKVTLGPCTDGCEAMFRNCYWLSYIELDLTHTENTTGMFDYYLLALHHLEITGLKCDIDLSVQVNLTLKDVKFLVDNAQEVTGKTIILPKGMEASMTSDIVEAATAKGFTIAYALTDADGVNNTNRNAKVYELENLRDEFLYEDLYSPDSVWGGAVAPLYKINVHTGENLYEPIVGVFTNEGDVTNNISFGFSNPINISTITDNNNHISIVATTEVLPNDKTLTRDKINEVYFNNLVDGKSLNNVLDNFKEEINEANGNYVILDDYSEITEHPSSAEGTFIPLYKNNNILGHLFSYSRGGYSAVYFEHGYTHLMLCYNEIPYYNSSKTLQEYFNSLTSSNKDLLVLGKSLPYIFKAFGDEISKNYLPKGLYLTISDKGVADGVASLDSTGKVPTSLLPSYVDDVLEYTTSASFPNEGETGKIYVDTTTNLAYRWSGTQYIEISPSLALGTTSSTAYPGNLGASLLASFDDLLSNVNDFADETNTSIETLNTLVSTITSNVATNTGNIKKVTNQVSSLQDTVNNIPTTIDSHIDDFVASRTLIVDGSSLNWSTSLSTTATSVSTLQTPTKANILNNDFDVILKVNANVRVKALPLESISNHISGTTSIVTTYEAIITTGSFNSGATIKVTRTSAGVISSVTVAKTGASIGTLAGRVTIMLAAVDDIDSSVNTLNTNVSNLQTSVNELEKSYIIGYIPSSGKTLTITKNNLSNTNWKNGNVDLYITTSTSTTTLTRVAKAAFKYSSKTSSTIYNVYSYFYGDVEYEIALNILNTTTTPSINGTVTKLGPASNSYPENSCVIDLSSVDITTITKTTHTEVAAAKTPKYGRVRDLTSCPLLLFKNNVIVRPHLTYEFLTPGTNCSYTYLINGSFGKVEVIILLNSTHTEILSVKYKKAS